MDAAGTAVSAETVIAAGAAATAATAETDLTAATSAETVHAAGTAATAETDWTAATSAETVEAAGTAVTAATAEIDWTAATSAETLNAAGAEATAETDWTAATSATTELTEPAQVAPASVCAAAAGSASALGNHSAPQFSYGIACTTTPDATKGIGNQGRQSQDVPRLLMCTREAKLKSGHYGSQCI